MFSHGIFSIFTLDYNIYAIFYYKKAVLGRALIDIKIKRAFCVSLLFAAYAIFDLARMNRRN